MLKVYTTIHEFQLEGDRTLTELSLAQSVYEQQQQKYADAKTETIKAKAALDNTLNDEEVKTTANSYVDKFFPVFLVSKKSPKTDKEEFFSQHMLAKIERNEAAIIAEGEARLAVEAAEQKVAVAKLAREAWTREAQEQRQRKKQQKAADEQVKKVEDIERKIDHAEVSIQIAPPIPEPHLSETKTDKPSAVNAILTVSDTRANSCKIFVRQISAVPSTGCYLWMKLFLSALCYVINVLMISMPILLQLLGILTITTGFILSLFYIMAFINFAGAFCLLKFIYQQPQDQPYTPTAKVAVGAFTVVSICSVIGGFFVFFVASGPVGWALLGIACIISLIALALARCPTPHLKNICMNWSCMRVSDTVIARPMLILDQSTVHTTADSAVRVQ